MIASGGINLYVLLFGVFFLYVDAQSDGCNSDLSISSLSSFNASGFTCQQVWKDFILRVCIKLHNIFRIYDCDLVCIHPSISIYDSIL